MPDFSYQARTSEGQLERGKVSAPDQRTATSILRDRGYVILKLQSSRGDLLTQLIGILQRVPARDLVIFSRQLATMIDASLPIAEALRVMLRQTENETLRRVLLQVTADLEGGAELSVAMGQYPEVFSDFYISIIRAGESSGRLPETMLYLADYLERDYDLKSRVRGALTYPAFLIVGMLGVGVLAVTYVIPQLTSLFEGQEDQLPVTTKVLIATSDFLVSYWIGVLAFLLLAFVAGFAYFRTDAGRLLLDRAKLSLPIVKGIYEKIVMARFAQTFATLLQGGIPVVKGLHIVSDVMANKVYEGILIEASREIEDGSPLVDSLRSHDEIPVIVSQLIGVGERTGRLEEVLRRLAEFYQREVQSALDNLVTIIEPVILVVMGIAVGILFGSIILPIYNLSSAF